MPLSGSLLHRRSTTTLVPVLRTNIAGRSVVSAIPCKCLWGSLRFGFAVERIASELIPPEPPVAISILSERRGVHRSSLRLPLLRVLVLGLASVFYRNRVRRL